MPRRPRTPRLTGPATRALARQVGINDRTLAGSDVVRLSRDTYLPRSLAGDTGSRIAAVLLNAPAGSVLRHATAAQSWGLAIPLQTRDDRVHLTVATGSAARGRADRALHRSPLDRDEVTRRDGHPVTTPGRTWRDLAGVILPAALLAVTDQLLVERCTRADLRRALDRRPTGRGAARARAVLPLGDRLAGSPMESVFRWLMHEAGLPAPVLQHQVLTSSGAFVGRVDFAWPGQKVLIEFDGDVHRDRRVFVDDLRRQNRLVAEGWVVLRFTSADVLGRSREVIAEIRRALAR